MLEEVVWSQDDELLLGDFSKIVILEVVGDGDLRTGGGVIRCCFVDGEDSAREEVPDFI